MSVELIHLLFRCIIKCSDFKWFCKLMSHKLWRLNPIHYSIKTKMLFLQNMDNWNQYLTHASNGTNVKSIHATVSLNIFLKKIILNTIFCEYIEIQLNFGTDILRWELFAVCQKKVSVVKLIQHCSMILMHSTNFYCTRKLKACTRYCR